jgi:hypothetical protein
MIDPIEIMGVISAARCDKEGAWKLTLDIPMSEGVNVAKLTALTETVFKVRFEISQDEEKELKL